MGIEHWHRQGLMRQIFPFFPNLTCLFTFFRKSVQSCVRIPGSLAVPRKGPTVPQYARCQQRGFIPYGYCMDAGWGVTVRIFIPNIFALGSRYAVCTSVVLTTARAELLCVC